MQVEDVLSRIKEKFSLRSDADLAVFLEISPQAVSSWRKRNSMNVDRILTKCVDADLGYLFYGRKKETAPTHPVGAPAEKAAMLEGKISAMKDEIMWYRSELKTTIESCAKFLKEKL